MARFDGGLESKVGEVNVILCGNVVAFGEGAEVEVATGHEAGRIELNLIQADIVSFLNYLIESFHSYAETHDVSVQFSSKIESLIIDYDPDRLTDIVSNLISNAIKFTPPGGQVSFSLTHGTAKACHYRDH